MGQVKIFGIKESLHPIRKELSDILHDCVVEAFQYPREKRAHRFIYLEEDSFYFFEGRSKMHTIIEVMMFEGRSVASKKKLYQLLFTRFETELGIKPIDLEITLVETPLHNWGIRGKSGDEMVLNYQVNI